MICALAVSTASGQAADEPPNIVIILADDMGYGDVGAYNDASKIPTAEIDRLSEQGMRFTDAHSAGSVCVPSRYGLVTGRYPTRIDTRKWREQALIDPDQTTIASLLSDNGYHTGMVGKWHLGFDGGDDYDCTKSLTGGPVDRGFDYYFGQPASLDQPPYFLIENRNCVAAPSETTPGKRGSKAYWTHVQGPFWRAGGVAPGFHHEDVLSRWREKGISFLEEHQRERPEDPFFLYLALTAPHTPWLPDEEFRGASRAGVYGDFAVQVDDLVGSVVSTLDRLGVAKNTLLIFSSDNGPLWYDNDERRLDHRSAYIYRGMKGDAWEGGHRIPFIVRWPGHVQPGTVTDAPVMFTDLLATFADVVGDRRDLESGEESVSILPVLQGNEVTPRNTLVFDGTRFDGVRQGKWKYMPKLGSGGFSTPHVRKPGPGEPAGQLYNIEEDPGETDNVYAEHPDIVQRLSKLLKRYSE